MESRSRPPAYDATSLMLSSAPAIAAQPPTYSSCLYSSNRDRSLEEYIPSDSGTSQRVIPHPLDCSGSVASSAHQSSTIAPGSSTRLTCATHPLSFREVGPGCEDLEFRSSASDSPPPSYETVMITSRPRPVKITSRDVTSRPNHVVSAVPSTPGAAPSTNHLPMSGIHRPMANRIGQPIPGSTSAEQPKRINHLPNGSPMSDIHRPIANCSSRPTPCSTSVEQPRRANLEDTVHRGGLTIIVNDFKYVCYVFFSFLVVTIILFLSSKYNLI